MHNRHTNLSGQNVLVHPRISSSNTPTSSSYKATMLLRRLRRSQQQQQQRSNGQAESESPQANLQSVFTYQPNISPVNQSSDATPLMGDVGSGNRMMKKNRFKADQQFTSFSSSYPMMITRETPAAAQPNHYNSYRSRLTSSQLMVNAHRQRALLQARSTVQPVLIASENDGQTSLPPTEVPSILLEYPRPQLNISLLASAAGALAMATTTPMTLNGQPNPSSGMLAIPAIATRPPPASNPYSPPYHLLSTVNRTLQSVISSSSLSASGYQDHQLVYTNQIGQAPPLGGGGGASSSASSNLASSLRNSFLGQIITEQDIPIVLGALVGAFTLLLILILCIVVWYFCECCQNVGVAENYGIATRHNGSRGSLGGASLTGSHKGSQQGSQGSKRGSSSGGGGGPSKDNLYINNPNNASSSASSIEAESGTPQPPGKTGFYNANFRHFQHFTLNGKGKKSSPDGKKKSCLEVGATLGLPRSISVPLSRSGSKEEKPSGQNNTQMPPLTCQEQEQSSSDYQSFLSKNITSYYDSKRWLGGSGGGNGPKECILGESHFDDLNQIAQQQHRPQSPSSGWTRNSVGGGEGDFYNRSQSLPWPRQQQQDPTGAAVCPGSADPSLMGNQANLDYFVSFGPAPTNNGDVNTATMGRINFTKKRRNRMRHDTAAAIALNLSGLQLNRFGGSIGGGHGLDSEDDCDELNVHAHLYQRNRRSRRMTNASARSACTTTTTATRSTPISTSYIVNPMQASNGGVDRELFKFAAPPPAVEVKGKEPGALPRPPAPAITSNPLVLADPSGGEEEVDDEVLDAIVVYNERTAL